MFGTKKYKSRQIGKNKYRKLRLENTNANPPLGRIIKGQAVQHSPPLVYRCKQVGGLFTGIIISQDEGSLNYKTITKELRFCNTSGHLLQLCA
ncbi:MAG: hypothetical protein ACLU8W_05260 [Clostridia bacterium]